MISEIKNLCEGGYMDGQGNTKNTSGTIFSIIAVVAFIILIVAVNATAIYFGSQKNKASEPLENPVVTEEAVEETEETMPFVEEPETEEAVIEETDSVVEEESAPVE